MKISIIVPIFNTEKYLPQCLASMANLKDNIEIILVNDGSTDGSLDIIEEFAAQHDNVKVLDIPNGGVGNARNCGMAQAQGDYIMFLDSDDILEDGVISVLERDIDDNPSVDILSCNYRGFDDKEYLSATNYDLDNTDKFGVLFQNSGTPNWAVWNKVYRLTLAKSVAFTSHFTAEDALWSAKVFDKANEVLQKDTFIVKYRLGREGSATRSVKGEKILDALEVMSEIESILAGRAVERFNVIATDYLTQAITRYATCEKQSRDKVKVAIKDRVYFLNNNGKKAKIMRILLKLIGINATARLLHFVKK